MDTLVLWLVGLLSKLQYRLLRPLNEKEFKLREDFVRRFFHLYLPAARPKDFEGVPILENAKTNWFALSGGEAPVFSFILPSKSIYAIVFGVESASWEEARLRGVTRSDWERIQQNLAILKTEVPKLTTSGWAIKPKLMLITWGTPIANEALLEHLDAV